MGLTPGALSPTFPARAACSLLELRHGAGSSPGPSAALRAPQMVPLQGYGSPREPRALFALPSARGPLPAPRWPIECEVIKETIEHIGEVAPCLFLSLSPWPTPMMTTECVSVPPQSGSPLHQSPSASPRTTSGYQRVRSRALLSTSSAQVVPGGAARPLLIPVPSLGC